MVNIEIGVNRFTREPVYYQDSLDFGVTILAATTRYGKSCVAKTIYTALSKFRPIVIIDYRGEHGDSRYPNFLSKHDIRGIPDLFTVEDFAFKLSDFNSIYDWASFGFPEMAAKLMAELARDIDLHNNDPMELKTILEKLPTTDRDLGNFVREYPSTNSYITSSIMAVTKRSINNRYIRLLDVFYNGKQTYIKNFGELLNKYPKLHINLNLTDLDVSIARANTGKILEQIHNYLESIRRKNKLDKWHIKPLFIIEEADKLVPKWQEDKLQPSSLRWLVEYGLKLQKYGTALMFITQDPGLMHEAISSIAHKFILGQMPDNCKIDNFYKEKTKKLQWHHESNYREFAQLRKGNFNYDVFIPNDIPCLG